MWRNKKTSFPLTLGKRVSEKLFLQDEFSDVKILCEGKIFPCHKIILCSQSEVFKSMLSNTNMVEASSGEIKIVEYSANVMESLLYFLYFDEENLMAQENKITIDLLVAADYYNIADLIAICVNHLKGNLSEGNVVEIMTKSYKINQKDLFEEAQNFVRHCKNNGKVLAMNALDEMKEINPDLAFEMLTKVVFQTREIEGGESNKEQFVFNDNYDETTVLRTLYVSGFNKKAMRKDLNPFFEQFKNLTSYCKRSFRVDVNDSWQFTGSVFLVFDKRENARKFLDFVSNARLIYNDSDALRVKWQEEFYIKEGLFKQEMASLRRFTTP